MTEPSNAPIPRSHLHVTLGVALVAEVLAVARYLLQGTGNIYTNTSRAFYVEDPLIGFSVTQERWVWLGLEALLLIAAVAAAAFVAWKLARVAARAYLAGRRGRGWLKVALLAFWGAAGASLLTPIIPVAAFVSGLPPHGAEAHLPVTIAPPAIAPSTAEASPATLPGVPAGRYVTAPGDDRVNSLVVQLAAGGETFDARFAPLTGELTLEPTDLLATEGRIAAPAASIDTGIALRSSHARADLQVDAHPELGVTLVRIDRADAEGADLIRFEATGRVELMGRSLELPVTGTVKALTAEERATLAVDAPAALLVNANLTIPLGKTPLDASSFDRDTIPVAARLLLTPAAAP